VHILWLKTELLHPVDKGGRIRTYNMLRELRKSHEITYLTLDDGTAAHDALEKANEYSTRVIRVPFETAPRGSLKFFAELVRNLASRLPYAIARYESSAMRKAVRDAVAGGVDVVVCDFLAPSLNVPDGLGIPTVLFQHNVESMIWERHASTAGGAARRIFFRSQWQRMRDHESREMRRFDHVVAVSAEDATVFRRDFGVSSVSHVPTGVDTAFFRPAGGVERRSRNMVFTGSMDWMPNEDAMTWFCGEILPRIRRSLPEATLTIVGRKPSATVKALASDSAGVEVTGSVPDVRPYIERADLFIVPIRIGGGTRLKIFEAMGMERAVLSTPVGAEGLPLVDGENGRLEETADGFARAAIELLRDPERSRALAANAARLVRDRFGWDAVATQFAETCASVVARRRDSSRGAN
jgi:polysaccharide biosynthesis protein PslH